MIQLGLAGAPNIYHPKKEAFMAKRSSRIRPTIALVLMSVFIVLYFLIVIWFANLSVTWLTKWENGGFSSLLCLIYPGICTLVVPFVGLILGFLPISPIDSCYGIYSLTPFRIYRWIVIPLGGIVSAIYFLSMRSIDLPTGGLWIIGTAAISFFLFVLVSQLSVGWSLKSCYCDYCNLTNIMQFERTRPGESVYGYKYQEHSGRTEEARVYRHGTSTGTTIQYRTGPYQENLGLHKFSTEYKIYVCEICGNRKVETERKETKV